ncbi:bifunctional precorrin-2 dehydrogenase/sirohydrochlorin ferrochelatase [Hansschlegelia beijingensis]|uniref:precorrin-2 dehydrogenase/sirohydrochlorin ferrochelatase family protein n=1 Tax=Hansschlegelia beijingensis TaxID=1133344 RepID=UPI00387F1593
MPPERPLPRLSSFPAFHRVADRKVLIVGSGPAAAAKTRLLGETSARIVVVSDRPGAELLADVARVQADLLVEAFAPGHLEEAALAFAATEDEEEDRRIAEAARAAGVRVNVVDRPELCDFITPAIVNRAPLVVAIGTEGADQ